MNKKRRISRLGGKLFAVSALGLALAFAIYCGIAGAALPRLLYSDWFSAYRQEQCDAAVESYRQYIAENRLTAQEAMTDQSWLQAHPNILMYTFSAMGADEVMAASADVAYSVVQWSGGDAVSFVYIGAPYTVQCEDTALLLTVYPNDAWYEGLGRIAALLAALAGFCAVMIPYICRLLGRISRLSRETELLMGGDLEHSIRVEGRDELAQLGQSMEGMRLSVLERIAGEREALRANTQLVTALSHDLRTPLTKLMGYLEILNYRRFETEREREEYLRRATDKVVQIKKMSDEMFSRFQVSQEPEGTPPLELVDGAELLGQVLSEQCYDLQREGFRLEAPVFDFPFPLQVQTDDILRVFDNLFSNLKKYADRSRPIRITVQDQGDSVRLCIENAVAKVPNQPDSHGIGLPTTAALMVRSGGRLETVHAGGFYRSVLTFTKAGPWGLPEKSGDLKNC